MAKIGYVDNTNWEEELSKRRTEYANETIDVYNALNKARLEYEEQLHNVKIANETKYYNTVARLGIMACEEDIKREKQVQEAKLKADKNFQKLSKKDKDKVLKEELDAIEKKGKKEIEWAKKIKAVLQADTKSPVQELYDDLQGNFKSATTFDKKFKALKNINSVFGAGAVADAAAKMVSDLAKKLEQDIDNIGARKGIIDTRLQGSKNFRASLGMSYWETMSSDLTRVAGVSPYVKQSDIANNIQTMVTSGIAFNVEQRAFLQTIKAKIADTFDATDGTLLRLIRIQQQDSTAARLGMESSLNAFLNNMYENTEYLKHVSDGVKTSLEEAMSLMSAVDAVGFEYQVQKWMGSLYSVGMSQQSVNSIAQAFGQLASGNIEGLSGGAGNLLVMAANNAGLSLASILQQGLTETNTNTLLKAMVSYLSSIAADTSGNRVVQQQLAKVYGISASDLRAASNLSSSLGAISKSSSNYNNSLLRLYSRAATMATRTGMGEMLNNSWDNFQYSMASGIASNPVLYGIYKAAGLLDLFGGIALPDIKAMGTGVNLQTNVADLMRVAALGGSAIGGIGSMMTSLSKGGLSGVGMLASLGIIPGLISTVSRGNGGFGLSASGLSVASSGYAGNADGGDIKNKTLSDANSDANKQLIDMQDKEEEDIKNKVINDNIVKIYELLSNVVQGTDKLHATVTLDPSAITSLIGGLGNV